MNSKGNNSNKFKNDINQSVYALFKINNELPLIKEKNNFEYSLTPKVMLMFSPNKTKNISRDNTRIGIDSIYSLNRLANNEMVEGGGSATIGFDFKKFNKSNFNENLSISLATVVRAKKNEDLPTVSSIGQKNSDIFGKIDVKPNENFDIRYDFAVDNNLDKTNYNLISSSLKVNNFVTTFEYSNDKTLSESKKYLSNTSKLKFSNNGLIGFDIRKNKKTNATEFYNLYYSYFNDCLEASIKFSKDFYYDNDINPEKQLEFTITVIPFGATKALATLQ